jgi:hypothetical protein
MKGVDLKNANHIKENLDILINDVYAVDFCVLLFEISQLFDDVYDEGNISKEEAFELMWKTMVKLPSNPFYKSYMGKLTPMIESYILQWMSANTLEDKKEMLERSYMLRAFLFQIFQFCAMLVHGESYAIEKAYLFQKLYGEKFEDYIKEFVNV